MTKRWLLRLGLFAGVTIVGFWFVLWLTAPDHRINQSSADRIQSGMSLEEVIAIVRVPPGNYTTPGLSREAGAKLFMAHLQYSKFLDETCTRYWDCDSGCIAVTFDVHDKVTETLFTSFPSSFIDRIRSWVRIR